MSGTDRFDVVVIGSGMGGLAAARALAQFGGQRVLVLEQHYTPGGMTHEFSRQGTYRFGTGLHYLSAASQPFLDFMTDGRAQFTRLPDDFDVLHFPGLDFAVPSSRDRFRDRLKEQFPAESAAIDRFFRSVPRAMGALTARNTLASFPAPVGALGLPVVERLFPSAYRTLWQEVSRSFRDPGLRAVVAARWGLYGPPPEESAFGYHASVPLTYFADGATHPVGGPAEISSLTLAAVRRRGVELRTRHRVHRIVVEGGRTRGVDVEDAATGHRYRIEASTVVSAAGARNTYALLPPGAAPGAESALSDLPDGPSTLMLFLGLDRTPAQFGLQGENHWFMPDLGGDGGFHQKPGDGTLYVSFGSLNNPAARSHTVEVLELVEPSLFARWRGTSEDHRPADYAQLKSTVTRRLLDRLDRQWPGFGATVTFSELATPLTFETYQNSRHGVFYGLPTTPGRLRTRLAGCHTPVPGLLLAGQDAWGTGVVGALAGGLMAAMAALRPSQTAAMWRTVGSGGRPSSRAARRSSRAARGAAPARQWQGYLRVGQVTRLTPTVNRIRLEPIDGGRLPFTFTAGQYLTLDLPVAVEPIERSYSVCSGPSDTHFVEIAVKREAQGLGSVFLHDDVKEGQALRLHGPYGQFTYDPRRDAGTGTLLLVAGGVGITPLMSVLEAAADVAHAGQVVLLAGYRTEEEILFRPELEALRARLPHLEVNTFVSRPGPGWQGPTGRIGRSVLAPYASDVSRVHLCGPGPMMQDVIGHLTAAGVPRSAIHVEAFTSSRSRTTRRERAHDIALAAEQAGVTSFAVDARAAGRQFTCVPGQSVLDGANAAQVPLPQSCDEGICGTCRVRVLSGSSETDTRGMFSAEEIEAGWRLACQTLPTSDLTIA
ncbi:FAD-dependent oxidoreductase [Promicromonospora thailandica]|uniref:Ferredoxin-NADP reductase n=1 Tax=Promicromonospora thailandica TaxID=765201 RepID=A0A9X2G660_9MICO|nr:FAD-dependent oxidoreductase [Promicromonospora thailandica]MCP2266067.1 Ferredoxin-NADP reductase [Promicromonospora thailandica]